eukprot:CAMPEP_0197029778 /NCGR_PEP_ID=MMETSP1384-20130603/9160_1 /TAXON_ID=29189 /ORGANISM="Ammonia sp." /LENGTH=278 /DNA_ID=CAMNT_0042459015 /DNA_START=78 /DNA_END=914 /DNA_ORIENTATION=+
MAGYDHDDDYHLNVNNSLQQLCIHFVNEKLQQCFMNCMEAAAQEMNVNNGSCLQALENARNGLFSMLYEECCMPKGSSLTFLGKFHHAHDGQPCVIPSSESPKLALRKQCVVYGFLRRLCTPFAAQIFLPFDVKQIIDEYVEFDISALFGIRHYFGEVIYDASTFLTQNQDYTRIHRDEDTKELMNRSENSLIKQMMSAANQEQPQEEEPYKKKKKRVQRKRRQPLMGQDVLRKMEKLMKYVKESTSMHFIHCVIDKEQLQHSQLMDAWKLNISKIPR